MVLNLNEFANDTVIDPVPMNANFAALVAEIETIEALFPGSTTFANIKTLSLPDFVTQITTSGWSQSGVGGAVYKVGATTDPPVAETAYSTNTLNGRPVVINLTAIAMPEQFGGFPNTDCTTAVETAAAYLSAKGGGTVFFTPGNRYGLQLCTLSPNVSYCGVYKQSTVYTVENAGNYSHPFFGGGLDRDTYYLRNWKALNNVSPGNVVTPTSGGDVSHFPVGSYVIVASTGAFKQIGRNGLLSDWQPYFAIPNKVIANDGTNLTLEEPIEDTITGAQIALYGDYTGPLPAYSFGPDIWAINNSIHDLTIDVTTIPAGIQGQPWAIYTFYKCRLYNIDTIGAWDMGFNSFAYSIMQDITAYNITPDANGVLRFLEIKTGTYSSTVRNVVGYCSVACTVSNNALVETGEYANRITVEAVQLHAPNVDVTFQFAAGASAAPGICNVFRNLYMRLKGCSAFVSTPDGPTYSGNPSYTGYVMEDCIIDSLACAQTVRTVPNTSGGTCQFRISNIQSIYANASLHATTAAAIAITDVTGFRNCEITRVSSDGPVYFAPTKPIDANSDLTISNCLYSGISQTASYSPAVKLQPWQITMKGNRRYRESLVRAGQVVNVGNNTTTNATTDTVVAHTSFPNFVGGSFGYSFGDSWTIEIEFEFLGTTGQKYFSLVDMGTGATLFTVTGAAADNYLTNGNYRVVGTITVYDGIAVGTYSGSMTISGGPSFQAKVALDTVFSSGPASFNLALHAHVDNAADGVQISRMNVLFNPAFG